MFTLIELSYSLAKSFHNGINAGISLYRNFKNKNFKSAGSMGNCHSNTINYKD
ncbi:hypothetical protein NTGBS_310030 [Candidatus Nitrotoga sp. BS]|nr:hypothetical protein NTGBS_310030 [Candidatus Nitrotoga sp. BS]